METGTTLGAWCDGHNTRPLKCSERFPSASKMLVGSQVLRTFRKSYPGYVFIALPVAAISLFLIIPMVASFAISLTEWNGFQPPVFVGLQNYRILLLEDQKFRQAFFNTTLFVLLGMSVGPTLGLLSALLLNQNIKFRALFRTAYFLPVMTSLVVVGTVWRYLYNDHGLLNYLLSSLGLGSVRWLNAPNEILWGRLPLISVVVASIWQGFGFETVIFLAALQNIPKDLYEAAEVDGANRFQRFWHVTLPGLRPVILFVYIIGIIGSYQVFDQVYVLTLADFGPLGRTRTIVAYLYDNFFSYARLGYASAVAYSLFLILAVFSYLQLRFFSRQE